MKHIKLWIYGEPGVGKSVFASRAPKPFFITTDGNYEWLEDFGAKPEDHTQVYSWEEAKKAFKQNYDNYDTIVVDLVEDLFKWCEQEFCARSKIEHVSDIGYGKGYDITRNEFFLEISKLLGKPKNVILISHGITFTTKDRRGVEHTRYAPSSRLPDKIIDMIEGRLRYCLRCYLKAEEVGDGELIKRRYLSLVPKENEFGIIRGIDDTQIPHDIPLDWNEFEKAIGFNQSEVEDEKEERPVDINVDMPGHFEEVKEVEEVVPQPVVTEEVTSVMPFDEDTMTREEPQETTITPTPVVEEVKTVQPVQPEPVVEPSKTQSNNDKLAAIKAKLAALKKNNN